jgi:NAD-dependent dihydropyrimidine dehydrogenase PreA subunit
MGSCPFDVIEDGHSEKGYPKMLIVSDKCKGCKLCIPYCPVGAIVPGEQPEKLSVEVV